MRREACLPCRLRKLRCDITAKTGAVCSRCVDEGRDGECIVPPRQKRSIQRGRKRSHLQEQGDDDNSSQPAVVDLGGFEPLDTSHDVAGPTVSTRLSGNFEETLGYSDLSPIVDLADRPTVPTAGLATPNDDNILKHVCEQISMPHSHSRITSSGTQSWLAFIEYQNPLHAAGILGELEAGYRHVNKIIQVHTISPATAPCTRRQLELHGLDEHEIALLNAKKAFSLPPRDVCKEFFSNFFSFAYPYAPILDRCLFLTQYHCDDYSSFVMQALLANAVSYASLELVRRAGFTSHQEALRTFYKRAVLLYDFNCEKDQLSLLQGSLLLGVQWISHVNDKDFRFWMATAIRLAMRMGLHRRHIEDELDPAFYRLLKRIWSVIWVRDVLLVTTGLDNGRRVPDDSDTNELIEEDWYEDASSVPEDLLSCLPIINSTQKLFFIHLSQLALAGREAHSKILSCPLSQIDHTEAHLVLQTLVQWKRALPFRLTVESIQSWTSEGIWVLVLATWACRIECLIHRTLWRAQIDCAAEMVPVSLGLKDAVFTLDTIIKRAVLHDLCRHMPLSIATSAAANGALAIELLCQPSIGAGEKLIYEEAVRNSVQFLSQVQQVWTTVRALLRLFAWVISRRQLNFNSGLEELEPTHTGETGLSTPFHAHIAPAGQMQYDETINPLLFNMDALMDWQTGTM